MSTTEAPISDGYMTPLIAVMLAEDIVRDLADNDGGAPQCDASDEIAEACQAALLSAGIRPLDEDEDRPETAVLPAPGTGDASTGVGGASPEFAGMPEGSGWYAFVPLQIQANVARLIEMEVRLKRIEPGDLMFRAAGRLGTAFVEHVTPEDAARAILDLIYEDVLP